MSTPAETTPPNPWPAAGALDLDDLLAELRSRAFSALRSQERLRDLLGAVVALATDLELSEVLGRIVESAMVLVDARYGALGVLSGDGTSLSEFITRGVTEEERRAIGPLPSGLGVLGLLIRHPHPQRIDDIASHPDSFGFPANHPPMHSFLGTPIRIREEVYGNLYLAEKQGASAFTQEDEATLVALAAAAGVAIENARLFETGRRRQRWADAVADIAHLLLEQEDEQGALRLLTSGCCEIGGARYAAVAMIMEREDRLELVLRSVHVSSDPDRRAPVFHEQVLDGPVWSTLRSTRQVRIFGQPAKAPLFGVVAEDGGRSTTASVTADELLAEEVRDEVSRALQLPPETGSAAGRDAPIAILPLTTGAELGLLVLGRAPRASSGAGSTEMLAELAEFAQQSGLALLAGRAQRDRSTMALMGDRDRIARDMHDHVIQRLFATGLSLQSASRIATSERVRVRIEEAVDDLDVAIREIRAAIFELHRPATPTARRELEALVSSYAGGIGEPPTLTLTGNLEHLTPVQLSDVTAVVSEALSNVARHAAARHAWVRVDIADTVTIQIEDDGIGVDPEAGRSGLVNLAKRAEESAGTFTLARRTPSGSLLTWQVPHSGSARTGTNGPVPGPG